MAKRRTKLNETIMARMIKKNTNKKLHGVRGAKKSSAYSLIVNCLFRDTIINKN
ncbi:hypothetical protein L21SP5_00998 [Salinivirga cyanobacteriivorans]|uniref:Uncharacterized protein n=1 Tax=Salinivirga cyanobacteriivorans TaxID=1307839 RepID=A0A0S2HX47_9BACT|nr:hypothetical protein L21SP5_00998 [Salinivirga cyanobacteriivorans]